MAFFFDDYYVQSMVVKAVSGGKKGAEKVTDEPEGLERWLSP